MEAIPNLSWAEIAERLTRIMHDLPVSWAFHTDPCAGRQLRLRDIAEWTGIERNHLYYVRRGERLARNDRNQQRLSRFFAEWDAGKLVKARGPDGKWRVQHFDPASEIPADAPDEGKTGISAQISWFNGTLKVKPKV